MGRSGRFTRAGEPPEQQWTIVLSADTPGRLTPAEAVHGQLQPSHMVQRA